MAVRYLNPDQLGTYAVGYTAYVLGAAVTTQLLFTPFEVVALKELQASQRLALPFRTLALGLRVSLVIAIVSTGATLLVPAHTDTGSRAGFGLSLLAATVFAPVKDHLRRSLHQSQRSWSAVRVSALQLAAVVLGGGIAARTVGLNFLWLPLGLLAVGTAASCAAGLVTSAANGVGAAASLRLSSVQCLQAGFWLCVGTGASFGSVFLVVALVTGGSGPVAAGKAEAARLIAQPVTVVIAGLMSVLGPEMILATQRLESARVRRLGTFVLSLAGALAVLYGVASAPWGGNPLPRLFPLAYATTGLLPVMIVAQAVFYASVVFAVVLLAKQRARLIAVVQVLAGGAGVIVGALMAHVGPIGIAAGMFASGLMAMVGFSVVGLRLSSR